MAIDVQSSERMLRMVPVLTKKRVYVVKTDIIRKFVPGFTVCRGALAFERGLSGYGNGAEVLRSLICCVWKVYRLSYRDFRFCQGSRALRMALVLTRDRYFLVKIGVICKNRGVGIGLASWGEDYVALASGRMRRVVGRASFAAAVVWRHCDSFVA